MVDTALLPTAAHTAAMATAHSKQACAGTYNESQDMH